MNERVTDEWLERLRNEAKNSASIGGHRFVFDEAKETLAFAQAVARECIEVIMCFNDRDEGVRNIRARFGLED